MHSGRRIKQIEILFVTFMRLPECHTIWGNALLRAIIACAAFLTWTQAFIFPLSSGDCVLPSSVSTGHPCHVAGQQDPCALGEHHRTQQTHTGQKHSNSGCDASFFYPTQWKINADICDSPLIQDWGMKLKKKHVTHDFLRFSITCLIKFTMF